VNLEAVTVFVRVAEALSFTVAAQTLGMPKSTVSKRVMELEQHLGTQLIIRSTRRLTLTETGRRYFENCRYALGTLEAAEMEALDWNATPQGTLRVSVPTLLGQFSLGRVLEEYLRACPRVNVELWLSDDRESLTADHFDVVILVEEPLRPHARRTRPLFSDSMVFCATPGYIERHGAPKHPRELTNHDLISYVTAVKGEVWTLTQGDQRISVPVECRLKVNSLIVAIDATLAGLGIGQVPLGLVKAHLSDGGLVRVLPNWQGRNTATKVICNAKRPLPLRTKLFLDHLERSANLELCRLAMPTFTPPRSAKGTPKR
jgi:DNA-binding transcriptional LysR family regulator